MLNNVPVGDLSTLNVNPERSTANLYDKLGDRTSDK
jgi:hypothetical protein